MGQGWRRERMTTTIKLDYFGMPGEGPTVKEAKLDAGRKIEAALKDSYAPTFLTFGSYTALVWREPSGWGYRLLPDKEDTLYACCQDSRPDTIRQAKRHLAQLADNVVANEAILAYVHKDDRKEIENNIRWQREMRELIAKGYTDEEARYISGGMGHLVTRQLEPAAI